MNRRDILAGAPALALLPGGAAAGADTTASGSSSGEDPILPHYREWVAAKTEWWRWFDAPGNGNFTFSESLEAERREDAAFEAMMQTPATTMEGIAALAHVLWLAAGPSCIEDSPDYEDECRHFEFQPLLAIWRSATGRDGVPPSFYLQRRNGHASH